MPATKHVDQIGDCLTAAFANSFERNSKLVTDFGRNTDDGPVLVTQSLTRCGNCIVFSRFR
jgi:hypothetical protein